MEEEAKEGEGVGGEMGWRGEGGEAWGSPSGKGQTWPWDESTGSPASRAV